MTGPVKPQFEMTDTKGSTIHYDDNVGTTPIAIPTVADKIIGGFWIENDINNSPAHERLSFSCDGGTTYTELAIGESLAWTPKGDVKQIYIKGSTASVDYQMIINYEEY